MSFTSNACGDEKLHLIKKRSRGLAQEVLEKGFYSKPEARKAYQIRSDWKLAGNSEKLYKMTLAGKGEPEVMMKKIQPFGFGSGLACDARMI